MGHKHTREDILAGAVAVAFADGLSQLTYGRVAKHLGINDRTVVYYFPTKDDLVSEVIVSLGAQLLEAVTPSLSASATDHLEVVRAAWPVLATEEADPVFALFFEANGLAASGREPYRSLVPQLVGGWMAWIEEWVDGPPAARSSIAAAALALIDGLLLVRQLAGAEAADRAARQLGVA